MIANQLTMQEARALLDYRDGTLFWKHAGSGRRPDLRAVVMSAKRVQINIGGKKLDAKYAVWNWHHGVTTNLIRFADGDRRNIRIENLVEVEKFIGTPLALQRIACPCCSQPVPVPNVYATAFHCRLTPMEGKILASIWDGGGKPVLAEKIFDRMYDDDADGGPSQNRMYATLKESLSSMRKKLIGSGVGIETVGYGRGWRLVLGVVKGE
jgi:hypothetical protein